MTNDSVLAEASEILCWWKEREEAHPASIPASVVYADMIFHSKRPLATAYWIHGWGSGYVAKSVRFFRWCHKRGVRFAGYTWPKTRWAGLMRAK